MFDNVGDDADELIDVLSNIDWQTASVSDLTALLDNAGIETDGFADKLAELIGLMKEGQNVGFDAAAEHYSSMKDFAKLKEDDSIEQADIDLLEAAGVDTSRFFKLMGDGSYQLCNDAEEFYRIVNEKSLDVFKTNLDSLYENRDSANAIVGNYTSDNIASASTSAKVDFLSALGVENENLASYQ
jgi:hypothetical protein